MQPRLIDRISPILFSSLVLALAGCTPQINPANSPAPEQSPTLPPTPSPSVSTTASPEPAKSEAVQTIETNLKQRVAEATNLTIQAVDCPKEMAFEPGKAYDCQMTAERQTFTVSVQMKTKEGEFQWGTKGLLLLAKLEQFIQKQAKERGKGEVTADCGNKIRIAKPGDKFDCKLTDAAKPDDIQTVQITVKDEQGQVFIGGL